MDGTRELWVESGDERLRQNRHIGRRRVLQAEVVGARRVKAVVDQLSEQLVEDGGRTLAVLRKRTRRSTRCPRFERRLHRPVRQAREVVVDPVDELVAKRAALFESQIEFHAGSSAGRCHADWWGSTSSGRLRSASRSILPFGLNGISARSVNSAGTMYRGSLSLRKDRRSEIMSDDCCCGTR